MRLIKLAIISAVVFSAIIFIMSLLIPSHIRISRAVNIHSSIPAIGSLVQDLDSWSEWNEAVINAGRMEYKPWEKKLVGEKLEIFLNRTTGDSVFTVWRNQSGKEIAGVLCLHQEGKMTIVQFYFDFYQRMYPWEKFASINLDKQWGPSMEKSLENLKKISERGQ